MRLVYCLLSPTFGMHQYTADLANRMIERHEVHLVTVPGYPADRYAPAVHVHTPSRLTNTGLSVESLRFRRLSRFKAEILLVKPDMVHFTGPHLWNPYLLYWLKRRGIQTIHSLHDLHPHSGTPLKPFLRFWNRVVVRLSGRILVHGRCYQQELLQSGLSIYRVVYFPLLHLFLSFRRTQTLIEKLEPVSYDPVILFFGRLEQYKGIITLIEAYRRYRTSESLPTNTQQKLLFAGPGNIPEEWRTYQPEGIEWRNRLIDDDEAEALFRSCCVLVLPYDDATQSALIGAAYFFHKPVIVTRSGALPEYVIEGQTGYVVPTLDVEVLANMLQSRLADKDVLKAMGDSGRKWYDEQRRLETHALHNLYETD
ncbi:MAG TPA: glycosyltransferase family 4 protein [Patescibacteria group bacterium]|nr:glycosyltransferase family 4 protein [Patescibacteria group bacterium]